MPICYCAAVPGVSKEGLARAGGILVVYETAQLVAGDVANAKTEVVLKDRLSGLELIYN